MIGAIIGHSSYKQGSTTFILLERSSASARKPRPRWSIIQRRHWDARSMCRACRYGWKDKQSDNDPASPDIHQQWALRPKEIALNLCRLRFPLWNFGSSPAQLLGSLFGSVYTSDVKNQTPIGTGRSTNRSSPRAYKQRPSKKPAWRLLRRRRRELTNNVLRKKLA